MRWCRNCQIEADTIFCPKCRNLTVLGKDEEPAPTKSKAGEIFECKIWPGPNFMRGIRIGIPNRDRYFSKSTKLIVLNIQGVRCLTELPNTFWRSSPEIRAAKDDSGKNYLGKWIEKHNLLPPAISGKQKGKEDVVLMEVVEPENEFKVYLSKEDKPEEF